MSFQIVFSFSLITITAVTRAYTRYSIVIHTAVVYIPSGNVSVYDDTILHYLYPFRGKNIDILIIVLNEIPSKYRHKFLVMEENTHRDIGYDMMIQNG